MKQISEDLFEAQNREDVDAIVIMTNGFVKSNGRCVMGRGTAKRARDFYPNLDLHLGQFISEHGNHVHVIRDGSIYFSHTGPAIVSFPTKNVWYEPSEMWLIERSCQELVEMTLIREWKNIWTVMPGIGNGGLSYEEVKPLVEKYFDDRFTICSLV